MKKMIPFLLAICLCSSTIAQPTSIDKAHELLLDGNLEEALSMFDELEIKNKSNAEFYFLRGSCQSELGDNNKAILDLNRSIELEKDNSNTYYQRGFAYFSIGNSEAALVDFNQALKLSPDYGEAYLNRGSVQYDLGNSDAACKDWQAALDTGLTLAQALLDQLCKS
ncbi:MAG: tetratricopeptide repeat protein [Reichenbachiella sp.]|uniref:tetratricopeptide repeat protein n=1 Tax=Reichenbachiella sp. TaxID=2184521 RepID=UPI003265AA40